MAVCRRLSKTANRLLRKSERHEKKARQLRLDSEGWRRKSQFTNSTGIRLSEPAEAIAAKLNAHARSERMGSKMLKRANRLGRKAKIETVKARASRFGAKALARTANRLHRAKKIFKGRRVKNAEQKNN